ncbi:MAG TPA: diguanylate cyclase, partial [Verrucomicrobiae bacterium]|nr:diguanylate cyclase [Verrucomicrobiae bacterium]
MDTDRDKSKEDLAEEISLLRRRVSELEELHRREVAERKRTQKALLFDELTQLPNRVLFFNHLKQSLIHMRRKSSSAAVLFFGIDRFKLINDSLGNEIGDLLLRQVGRRLSETVRKGDVVARPGRDEFMILMPDIASPEEAAHLARNIFEALRRPFSLKRHELLISGSIGISMFPCDGMTPEVLLRNAYTALVGAREAGAGEFRFFSPNLNSRAFDRMLLENSLRVALERDQFSLHFQPQVDMATARVTGTE